jgi:hypothetical protein
MTGNLDPVPTEKDSVISYRLASVEESTKSIHTKLDNLLIHYATKEYVTLLINPLIDRIIDLENARASEETSAGTARNQFKFLIIGVLLTPIVSVAVYQLLGGQLA